ncbi:MAG: tetratricopeptide repeat protein [Opitutales bacterium]
MRKVSAQESMSGIARRILSGLGCALVVFLASGLSQNLAPRDQLVTGSLASVPKIDTDLLGNRVGSGLIFGILGGFRTIAADISWLRMNEAWEDRNLAETEALIRLTLLIDSRPEVFWKAGAHTIGFDMPVWRIREGGGESVVPQSVQERIRREQMQKAVDLLEQGARLYPENPMFPIETGKVYLNATKDYEKTIEYFRKAWEMPNSPPYIGRLLARVLETVGRPEEALEILRVDLWQLSADDPEAYIGLVRERIAELEFKYGL